MYIGIGTIFKSGEGHIERLHTTTFHIDSKAFGNDVEDDTDTFINSLQDLECILVKIKYHIYMTFCATYVVHVSSDILLTQIRLFEYKVSYISYQFNLLIIIVSHM